MTSADLTIADFIPLLDQTFRVSMRDSHPYDLTLVRAYDLGDGRAAGPRRPFSLIFSNPRKDSYLPQRTYCLEHGKLGVLEIFLVPIGPDENGMFYEAVFT
ncbi:MAG: hypothetical protein HYX75_15445 [Acidobacteria bacterium]|nr:hypothetical protein [Acidobacteriota bacterium]